MAEEVETAVNRETVEELKGRNDLELICENLDDLMKQFLLKIEERDELRKLLSQFMKDGFLSLSSARYSMGLQFVGQLQIPDRTFDALVTCRTFQPSNINETWRFEINHNQYTDELKSTYNNVEDAASNLDLRQRKTTKTKVETGVSPADSESENHGTNTQPNVGDIDTRRGRQENPLNWFGVLVPQSLKQGQNSFKKAVEIVFKILNCEKELEKIIQQFSHETISKITILEQCKG